MAEKASKKVSEEKGAKQEKATSQSNTNAKKQDLWPKASFKKLDAAQNERQQVECAVPVEPFMRLVAEFLVYKARDYKAPGFRPGKVPLNMVQARFGQDAAQYAAEQLVDTYTKQYLDEKKIKTATSPSYEIVSFPKSEA